MNQRIVGAAVARHVPLQRAELLGEGDLLVLVETLVAEAQDLIPDERVIDRLARCGIEWSQQN